MSLTTKQTETETHLTEIKDQAKESVLDGLKRFARGFWAHTEANKDTNTKPFDGWL